MADVVANRFQVLTQHGHDSDSQIAINDAIAAAVQTAVGASMKTINSATPKQNTKTRSVKIDGATIGEIVGQVVLAIQPLLIEIITSAVGSATKLLIAELSATTTSTRREMNSLGKEVQMQKFEIDRLQQYQRRDAIRVSGIPEREGEDTNAIIRGLAADIGVTLANEDISISHRLPGRPGTAKPIIVKFVRRRENTNGEEQTQTARGGKTRSG